MALYFSYVKDIIIDSNYRKLIIKNFPAINQITLKIQHLTCHRFFSPIAVAQRKPKIRKIGRDILNDICENCK